MSVLDDLLGSDFEHTFRFFLQELNETVHRRKYNEDQIMYVASVLARFASIPWSNGLPGALRVESSVPQIFTRTELSPYLYARLFPNQELLDAEELERKGAYIFLMIGFFRSQMEHQNNVRLYEKIAQSYYHQAHQHVTRNKKRKQFLGNFSYELPFWAYTCNELNKNLRDKRLLLRFD